MYFYKKRDYIESKKQLRDEYAAAYQKAESYIHLSSFGLNHEEGCLMQIMDDFLSAQKEGKPLSHITGPNLRKFCDNMMKAEFSLVSSSLLMAVEIASGVIFCMMLFTFAGGSMFDNKHRMIENPNNLHVNSFIILIAAFYIMFYHLKNLIARVFFGHIRTIKISNVFIMSVLYLFSYIAAIKTRNLIHFSFPLPFPAFVLISVFSLAVLIMSIIIEQRKGLKYKSRLNNNSESR